MKQLIKQADLLVSPFEFNIKEQGAAVSVLGGCSSILIIIFTICYFLGLLIKSLGSLSDIYAGSQSDQDTNSVKQLENTLVAIELSNDKGKILSNMTEISQYIKITGQYIQQQRIEEIEGYKRNYTSLNIINCSKDKVEQFNFDPEAMTQRQQENLICFDGYFNLKGQFYDSYFSFFRIMVQVCNNQTSNNCKSLEEIKSFVDSGIKIDLFIQSARIRLKYDEQNPAYLYANTIYWKLSSQAANNEDIYMETVVLDIKKTKFLNNVFGVSNDERIFQGQVVSKQERRQDSTSIDHNAVLASFYLRQSAESQYYFMLQQDFIALFFLAISQSNGLLLAILDIAKFFYRFYSERYSLKTIMNNIFLFNLRMKEQKQQANKMNNSQNQEQGADKQIIPQQLRFSIFSLMKYELTSYLMKKKSNKKQSELPTDAEIYSIFSAIAKKNIEKELDLSNILKKLYEIDFLKLLLLDDNQLRLFNAICKPIFSDDIFIQNNEEQNLVESNQKKVLDQEQQIINLGNKQQNQSITCQKNSIEERCVWFPNQQLQILEKVLQESVQKIKQDQKNQINQKLLSIMNKHTKVRQFLEKDATTTEKRDNQTESEEKIINTQKSQQYLYREISQQQNNLQYELEMQQNYLGNYQQQNDQIS